MNSDETEQGDSPASEAKSEFKIADIDGSTVIDRVVDAMPASHNTEKPLVITNVDLDAFAKFPSGSAVGIAMKGFKDVFDDSSQKVSHS